MYFPIIQKSHLNQFKQNPDGIVPTQQEFNKKTYVSLTEQAPDKHTPEIINRLSQNSCIIN